MSRSAAGTRSAFPQNYVVNAGTLFEDFETLGDWTQGLGSGSPSGSTAADTTNVKTGTKGLQITATNGGVYDTKVISRVIAGNVGVWIYTDTTNLSSVTVYLASTTNFSKNFSALVPATQLRSGWNFVTFSANDWTNTGGESWANTMVRLRVRIDATASQTAVVTFDSLYYGVYARPKVVIVFDDGFASAYTEAFAYMQTKGLKGTIAVNSTFVGTTNYVSLANLQEMYAAGWDMANHTSDHSHLTTLGSVANQKEKFDACATWLLANSFSADRGGRILVYPYGEFDANTLTAVAQFGADVARTTIGYGQNTVKGLDIPFQLKASALTNTTTLATAKGYIDTVIARGQTCILYGHKIVASPTLSTEFPITDFQSLIDYILAKQTANQLDVMTFSEWYAGLAGSRRGATGRVAAGTRQAA